MGDDDDVMRFEITDQDLDDEMRSSYGKRTRMSKNKTIYGVWADNSDSEGEEVRPSFGGKKDYSAPVNFVSAGIQNQKKDKEAETAPDDPEEASSDEVRGGRGLEEEEYSGVRRRAGKRVRGRLLA
mgnify:CR=1 FL=1